MERSLALVNSYYFPLIATLLFFFNSAFFDGRISLVFLCTPVWIYLSQSHKAGIGNGTLITGLVLLTYIPLHYLNGIESLQDYFQSFLVLVSLLVFINVAQFYIKKQSFQLDEIFRKLLILNAFLALVSLIILFIPGLKETVWYVMSISEGIEAMPRLKLFTPEASHYSLAIAPLFIYFSIRCLFNKVEKPLFFIILASFPLLLSFSLGVIAALCISFTILLVIKYRQWFMAILPPGKILVALLLILGFLTLLYFIYPDNPLYIRIQNLLEGNDTSGRGRTYESFILADKIAALKSELFGIGPGQLKLIGRETIVQYYFYTDIPEVIRIPNATAESLAYYGYVGLALRILTEIFLFIKTKVWENPFRLWLFLFIFIYQLTGSYINNAYEYILWILAFTPIFPDLNFKKIKA